MYLILNHSNNTQELVDEIKEELSLVEDVIIRKIKDNIYIKMNCFECAVGKIEFLLNIKEKEKTIKCDYCEERVICFNPL